MFDPDFYPTPPDVIATMLDGEIIKGKTILEPEAGKGDIVDYLLNQEALAVLAAEKHPDLRVILEKKCTLIGAGFLRVESHQVSHIDMIVMNPPFSADDKHITHAFNIAPPGCKIIALCNYVSFLSERLKAKLAFRTLVEQHGTIENLGPVFAHAEEVTTVDIGLIKMQKPGASYEQEFEGFFMTDDQEPDQNALMTYNVVRDLVNRYVAAVKIFDKQLAAAGEMYTMIDGYFEAEEAMSIFEGNLAAQRSSFKRTLQKSGWRFIFSKLNLEKYSTKGLKEDISKFVETQVHVPFTVRNVYHMLEIVIGTNRQRMDKALLEVFDKVTSHHSENQYRVEGWKTNSHYLITPKFILPYMCYQDQRWYQGETAIRVDYGGNWELIEDLVKALCYISGDDYDSFGTLSHCISKGNEEYGCWFNWAYFRVKAFKKGSMHFEFNRQDLWGRFNERIARLKGYPLFETKTQTAYQRRQTSWNRAKRA
jgi:hypothetical protein